MLQMYYDPLEYALKYAGIGLAPVPLHYPIKSEFDCIECTCFEKSGCANPGKHPVTKGWTKRLTLHVNQLKQWFKREIRHQCNVGIATGAFSGIVCLDIDPRHGGDETLAALLAEYGPLPPTWEAATGSGGRHIIFRHPDPALKIGNVQNAGDTLGPGLDIRGDGGQFVAYPSLHYTMTRYTWTRSPFDLGREGLADLPPWLLAKLVKPEPPARAAAAVGRTAASGKRAAGSAGTGTVTPAYALAALEKEVARVADAPPGKTNEFLNIACKVMGELVGSGVIEETVVEEALKNAARAKNHDESNIERTFRSGIEAGKRDRRDLSGVRSLNRTPPARPVATGGGDGAAAMDFHENHNHPRRLARLFMEVHERQPFRLWRDEWWQYFGGVYQLVSDGIVRDCVSDFIYEQYCQDATDGLGERHERDNNAIAVRKVTTGDTNNVLAQLCGMQRVHDRLEMPCWLNGAGRDKPSPKQMIVLQNGILRVDRYLDVIETQAEIASGNAAEDTPCDDPHACLLPHDLDYFTNVRLPVAFDPDADCPRWKAFLDHTLEGDAERIMLLQQWFGYCLQPYNPQQKFMFFQGEGGNGKGVIFAVLEALLGRENKAAVPLEMFAEKFQLTATLGKLVNIDPDTGVIDKLAEGSLKSFTGGDTIIFDRKFKSPITTKATAKLMLAANQLPKFADRSRGVWRRLILMPMRVTVTDENRTVGMDDPEYWNDERAGILNWACNGLLLLRQMGRFIDPELCRAEAERYRLDCNYPAQFITEHLEVDETRIAQVPCDDVYRGYKQWCAANNYQPLNANNFGHEIRKLFPGVERKRTGSGSRYWFYLGLRYHEPTT